MKHHLYLVLGLCILVFCGCVLTTEGGETAGQGTGGDAWSVDVGFLDFPTSASAEAQEHFLRGVAILHSFGYKQARQEFQKAQETEPDFALAYWGETLCYNHPLLPERDLDSPRAVLGRLGATPEERLAKAPTEREKGFLQAVETLFGEGETAERRIGYMKVMQGLYETYPEDPEVAAFYALSLLAAVGPMGDDTFRLNVEAGAIALGLFARNPDHPGAAHYIIHAFDDPVHAPLALPAAWRFAEIAAAVSHARHMPSHIFIQRGMWEEVSRSNDSAYEAAVDLWEPGDSVADTVHALDWGHYGDLQRGDYAKARLRMEQLDTVVEKSEGASRAMSTVPLLWARYAVETEEWETRPVTPDSTPPELLVTGIAAARMGDLELAQKAEKRLEELGNRQVSDRSTFQRGARPSQVMYHEVAAMIRLAQHDAAHALSLLERGIEIAESMGPPRGSATPVKPVHELYGEVLLELDHPEDAIAPFEASLLRTPNRPLSLLGLARAHARSGDEAAARVQYEKLAQVWAGRDELAGLVEAKEFLAGSAAPHSL